MKTLLGSTVRADDLEGGRPQEFEATQELGAFTTLDGSPHPIYVNDPSVAFMPYTAMHPRGWMTPSMRLTFVWMAQRPWENITVSRLVESTGMSLATAKRSLAGLRDLVPMSVRISGPTGRTHVYRIDNPRAFIAAGIVPLGAAVVSRVKAEPEAAAKLPLAGLSALAARCSGISAPEVEIRACGRKRARKLARAHGDESTEVLVLSYDPLPMAEDGLVDPATMALTCASAPGARVGLLVAAALEETLADSPGLLELA